MGQKGCRARGEQLFILVVRCGERRMPRAAGQAVRGAVVAAVPAGATVDAGGVTAPAFEAYLLVFALSGVLAPAGAAALRCVPEWSRPVPWRGGRTGARRRPPIGSD